jgi:hypothetical protein
MDDAAVPPLTCPYCLAAGAVALIATVTSESTRDIFLCRACLAQFTKQRGAVHFSRIETA